MTESVSWVASAAEEYSYAHCSTQMQHFTSKLLLMLLADNMSSESIRLIQLQHANSDTHLWALAVACKLTFSKLARKIQCYFVPRYLSCPS